MQHDNKFVFVRFNTPVDPIDVKTRFVAVKSSVLGGSAGMEYYFLASIQMIGLDDSAIRGKFAGVTTYGESANTGRNFWCACHRSD